MIHHDRVFSIQVSVLNFVPAPAMVRLKVAVCLEHLNFGTELVDPLFQFPHLSGVSVPCRIIATFLD